MVVIDGEMGIWLPTSSWLRMRTEIDIPGVEKRESLLCVTGQDKNGP